MNQNTSRVVFGYDNPEMPIRHPNSNVIKSTKQSIKYKQLELSSAKTLLVFGLDWINDRINQRRWSLDPNACQNDKRASFC